MSSEKHQIQTTEPPVREAVLFVCEKCGKSGSRDLARDLKNLIKDRGLKDQYRVALSSCMRVCPDRGIAIAVAGGNSSEFVVASGDAAEVLAFVSDKRRS